jgi:hypothetical protein
MPSLFPIKLDFRVSDGLEHKLSHKGMHEAFVRCKIVQNNPLCMLFYQAVALVVSQKVMKLIVAENPRFEYLKSDNTFSTYRSRLASYYLYLLLVLPFDLWLISLS